MRVIRSAGQNVSPSDDGRLFDQIFTDGLFEETTITHLGANNVALGAMYGIICGRDFTAEAQTVAVELPEDDAGTTGYIYVEIDTSSDDVITIGSALAPFTPTYEDLNTNGAVAQMIIAEYVASSVAITSLTPSYVMATSGSVLPGSVATVEVSPAVANHAVGDFILYGGQLYSVTAAISVGETLTPGTNISATSAGNEISALKSGLNNHFRQISSGSIYDINVPGIYYLTSAVTDKPIAGGGVYIVSNLGEASEFGIFVSAYSPEVFQVRNASGTHNIDKLSIDTVTVSGTTSSSGAVDIPAEHRGKRFLNALLTSGSPGFVIRRDASYFTVFNNDGTPKANTAVVFDAYFI